MSDVTQNIKSFKKIYPQVYSYILPDLKETEGSQKIGYTEKENVDERILQQVHTPAFKLKYEKLWSAPAFYEGNNEDFFDKTFHKFLLKNGVERKINLGKEWFYFNGEPQKSKELFDLFCKEKFAGLQNDNNKLEYTLRFEQEEAVKKALDYFRKNDKGEFLWNAKPRFGKTLASYDLVKRLDAKKVLIVTNRPAIANSWFDDYENFIEGYSFISETSSLINRRTITREQHVLIKPIKPLLTFLSLQDLKGSKYFGGNFDKLRWVADLGWDLLIIDEAHEGIDTGRTDAAFDMIKRKYTLHLSGTPFKALANEKFSKEAIYNWTYLDEQKIKKIEINEGESGEHTDMPELKLFTYRISQMITNQVNEGIEIDNENFDFAFDLNEFFRAKDKQFVREKEVKEFISNLTTNKKYPFSTPELREELKHTFWYVGNRVDSVKALEQLLKKDPVFKDYEIIVAAGDGRSFQDEENDIRGNEKSFEKVKKAIQENDKTITLSCGQLTTGVTIKEWSAVLMLTDIKSPALYMQAAFRAQNPYKKLSNGEFFVKKSSYLFDFAPTRVLEIYDQFANGLNPAAVKAEISGKGREENIKELLNFFPVISEDVTGEMVELDAEKVLTFPNTLAASEIVNARFMSNLLFNDSLKGVFSFPKEVEDILDKMPIEKNKGIQKSNGILDLDDARKVNDNKSTKISENTEIILGEKIFKTNAERVVDNLLNNNKDQIPSEELVSSISQVAEPLIAKYKEVFKSTQAETNEATRQIQEKVKLVADEFNSNDFKDSAVLKLKLIEILEEDFVKKRVAQKEQEIVEKVQKTKEEEIKDRLRSFTRTIPMFIMANSLRDEITIDNFDIEINDNDFLELTSISKEEFHKLRDGFEYEENGIRKSFQGVFNKYRFNASITEFQLKKEQLANYFTSVEDIFELIPNQKTNQIFTPKKVVQMMINNLEEKDPSLFTRNDSKFIDIYMKSGMYITEIVKKLFTNTLKHYKNEHECLKHILENQVYGLSPTPILQGITQSYIFGFDKTKNINCNNFIQHDLLTEVRQGLVNQKIQELFKLKENMKFDAVIGNPPYQMVDGGGRDSAAIPLYHLFVEGAKKLQPKYISMIMPARWYSGGRGLDNFRDEMLNDKRLLQIHDFPETSDCFPGLNIRGGICFFLWDFNHNGDCNITNYKNGLVLSSSKRPLLEPQSDVFIRFNAAINIFRKVRSFKEKTFDNIVSKQKPFGFRSNFSDFSLVKSKLNNIKLYRFGEIGYINSQQIEKNSNWVKEIKVIVSKASPGGDNYPHQIISKPLISEKNSCCTETYLVVGPFAKIEHADFVIKYMQTRFFRFMVALIKNTQNIAAGVFSFVPIQDFNEEWTDEKLFAKYGITKSEIEFIDTLIRIID